MNEQAMIKMLHEIGTALNTPASLYQYLTDAGSPPETIAKEYVRLDAEAPGKEVTVSLKEIMGCNKCPMMEIIDIDCSNGCGALSSRQAKVKDLIERGK